MKEIKLRLRLHHYALIVMTVLLAAQVVAAQQPKAVITAPVPEQIMTARKIFISNHGAVKLGYKGEPDRNYAYIQFYAAMKSWGRYELTAAPGDADLILEIRVAAPVGEASSGSSSREFHYILVILEPKTHTALWEFDERIYGFNVKNFDKAMTALVTDLKNLVANPEVSLH